MLHCLSAEGHPFECLAGKGQRFGVYSRSPPCIQQTEDESAAGRAVEGRHSHSSHTRSSSHAQSPHTGSNVECMSNVKSLSNAKKISNAANSAAAPTLFEAEEAQDSPEPQHGTEKVEAREEACVCSEREEASVCEERSASLDATRGSSASPDTTPQPRPLHLHLHLPIQNDRHQLARSWWSKTTSWSDAGHFTVHEARRPPEKQTEVQEEEAEWETEEWEAEEPRPPLPQPHPAYHPAQPDGHAPLALLPTVSRLSCNLKQRKKIWHETARHLRT